MIWKKKKEQGDIKYTDWSLTDRGVQWKAQNSSDLSGKLYILIWIQQAVLVANASDQI